MPFTISHAVAVLPFRHLYSHYFSLTALFVGSMVPDFEFFVRMTLYGVWGHTWAGIVYFDIPLGLLLCWLFHRFVRLPLIDHLPDYLYRRFASYRKLDWTHYLKSHPIQVVSSLLIGILTHFVLDNFTHEEGYISHVYFEQLTIRYPLMGREIPLYHLLQIISSLLGMLVIFYYIHFTPSKPVSNDYTTPSQRVRFWFMVVVLGLFIGFLRWVVGIPDEKLFEQYLVISISAFLWSISLISARYLSIGKV